MVRAEAAPRARSAGESLPSGALRRAIGLMEVLAERRACSPQELMARTRLPRPTLYRLLKALEEEHLVARDPDGRVRLGLRILAWATSLGDTTALLELIRPTLVALRDSTGESVQLYVREGKSRVCVASFEPSSGLRVTVPVGTVLALDVGSGGKAFLPWSPDGGEFTRVSPTELQAIRKQRWAQSVAEREAGVASVSSPVLGSDDQPRAVITLSGPADRFGATPGQRLGPVVRRAATDASALLVRAGVIK